MDTANTPTFTPRKATTRSWRWWWGNPHTHRANPARTRACLRGEFSLARFRACMAGQAVGALRASVGMATCARDIDRLGELIESLVGRSRERRAV